MSERNGPNEDARDEGLANPSVNSTRRRHGCCVGDSSGM